MSLELVRESTKVNYVVGEELAQTIVEHDIMYLTLIRTWQGFSLLTVR